MKLKHLFILSLSTVYFSYSQVAQTTVIDGVAAIVDENIILKSDVAQLVQMTLFQQRINPQLEPEKLIKLQEEVLQSMIDQKIILEMAKLDSIEVTEREVEQALDQQIDNMIAQAGSEENAEKMLGQSLRSLRKEYQQDMEERLITERYQQQLLNNISISRQEVAEFFDTYEDSLPNFPTQVHLWHILNTVEPGDESRTNTLNQLNEIKSRLEYGESFEELAATYSQDPGSASRGGDLGYVRRGALVPEFEAVAFTLEEGKISDPVQTQFGYHLIQTLEKQGEKIHARHILITPELTDEDESITYQAMQVIADSISSLKDFNSMAKTYSKDDETKGLGGDLGWVNPQEFPIPEVAEILNYIELNQCSPPVKTQFGYHLFWVEDIKPGGKPDLTTHWPDIEAIALNHKKMDWYTNWIERARGKFYIQSMD